MPTSPSGIPYPSGSAAPAAAADMMAMAEFLDGHTVLTATDEANRDALWGDLPAPVVVASKARPAVWLKVSDTGTSADWRTMFEDTGWITTGAITPSAGFDVSGPAFRRKNGIISATFTVTRTGADITSNSSGNITNVEVGLVDAAFRPYSSAGFEVTATGQYVGLYVYNSGYVSIGHMLPNVTWSTGTSILFSATYMAGDA